MKLKYLVYMLSFLTLIGIVSAGTYSQTNCNGIFEVTEMSTLNTKFDKNIAEDTTPTADYYIEKSFLMKGNFGYVSCYVNNDKGCIVCDGEELSKGYGPVYNYVQDVNNYKGDTASFSGMMSAFRDDYKSGKCKNFGLITNYESGEKTLVCADFIN